MRPAHDSKMNWEEASLFQNRPYTTLEFERHLDRIFQWVVEWSYEEKCGVTEKLLQFCDYGLVRFLWTVLEPMVHRDFIYNQMDASPQNSFHTLSNYVSRELYARLEKTVNNKYRRKRKEVYRIPSSLVKNEEDVRDWSCESVLPVIKGFERERATETRLRQTRLKTSSSMAKTLSTLPCITPASRASPRQEKTSSLPSSLSRIPIRYQTKKRHLQRDEASCPQADARKEFICRNSHERSHMNVIAKARSLSALDQYEDDSKARLCKEFRSQTSLGITTHAASVKTSNEEQLMMKWFQHRWNEWQRKEFLQLYLQTLDTSQIYLLYGFLMVRLYHDFISLLPRNISIKILSYLSSADLVVAAKVCMTWKERASDDSLWKEKFKERDVKASHPRLNWKETYLKYESLEEHWRKGKYSVYEFVGHSASVTAVRIFKNILASGSVDKTVKIWNIETGELLQTLRGHAKGVWGLRFMSKMLLVSCSNDQTIKIWNLRKGICARTFMGHDGGIWCIEQKGDLLVSGSTDKTAKIWNLRHCRLKSTLTGHVSAIFGVDFDPDLGLVFTGSADKTVRMWNMATSECLKCVLVSTENFPVTCISYHKGLLACSFCNSISIWDTENWECVTSLRGHRERVETLQLSSRRSVNSKKTTKVLVSCSKDGKVKYWDVDSSTCLQSFRGHEDSISCVIFDDTRIITASQDSTIKLWDFL